MINISKTLQIILIVISSLYLIILTSINLFKTEYGDPPYNYLARNWLNSPIKEIEIENSYPDSNIKKFDNQGNIGFFKSNSKEQDLNIFYGYYFKIKLYTPYYYPNFVGFSTKNKKKSENYKICGKDSQNNLLYFPKDEECPINFITLSDDNNICDDLGISNCKYQRLKDNKYLITSNKKTNGQIITQLRVNYNNIICADSSVDLTFNDLLENYENYECKEEYGYDPIYIKVEEGGENIYYFLDKNNLKDLNIKKNDKILLSYRGYLGVDNISNFEEHPIDHVTYARKIAFSKNIILFISCFYYAFCSIFILYFNNNNKYYCFIKIIFIIYCVLFVFNISFDFHVFFTFLRVKGIIKTVKLDGLSKYKTGLRWFIIIDIILLFGIIFDLIIKIFQFIMYVQNYKKTQQSLSKI